MLPPPSTLGGEDVINVDDHIRPRNNLEDDNNNNPQGPDLAQIIDAHLLPWAEFISSTTDTSNKYFFTYTITYTITWLIN